jgi:RNA polymerase subunit RPABC4/transcription elongation factor Spt4
MSEENFVCPECESEEFITEPNQYDVLVFEEDDFVIQTNDS